MAPAKKKQLKKMSLQDFIADTSFGSTPAASWADEDVEPTFSDNMSSPAWSKTPDSFGSRPEAFSAARTAVPIPDSPPFTARVANLDYNVEEDQITSELFDESYGVTSVRVPKDHSGRSKGYVFVEFDERSGLEKALSLDGKPFYGRQVRISVAEKRAEDSKFGGNWRSERRGPLEPHAPADDRDYEHWERKGPLPSFESRGPPRERREPRPVDERDYDSWERKGPLPAAQRERQPFHANGPKGNGFRRRGDAEDDDKFTEWRAGKVVSSPGPRKLELKPRSVNASAEAAAPRSSSLFGNAKPVDTESKLLEVSEKYEKYEKSRHHTEKEVSQTATSITTPATPSGSKKSEVEVVSKRFAVLQTTDDDEDDEQEREDQGTKNVQETIESKSEVEPENEESVAEEEDASGDWNVVATTKKRK